MIFEYSLCGLRVVSEIELPDLLHGSGEERAVDVEIVMGSVPDTLPGAIYIGPFLQLADDRQARVEIRAVAAYHFGLVTVLCR